MTHPQTLGERLYTYRQLTGSTLKDVAHFTGLSISFLSDMERDVSDPSWRTLVRLARFYNVTLDVMLRDVRLEEREVTSGKDS